MDPLATSLSAHMRQHRPYHSRVQIQLAIVAASGITSWGKYTQCVREINTRLDSLIERAHSYREVQNRKSDGRDTDLLDARHHGMRHVLNDSLREFAEFIGLADALAEQTRGLPETQPARDDLALREVCAQIILHLRTSIASGGGIGQETWEQLRHLHELYPGALGEDTPDNLRITDQESAKRVLATCDFHLTALRDPLPDHTPRPLSLDEAFGLIADMPALYANEPELIE